MAISLRAAALLLLTMSAMNAAAAARPGWIGLGLHYDPGTNGKLGSVYVRHVLPGSPAAVAGLKSQDLITSVNGKPTRYKDAVEAIRAFSGLRPGQRLRLVIVRAGRQHAVTLTAEAMPDAYYEMWKNNEAAAKAPQRP